MKGFIFTNFLDFVEKSNGLDMVDEMLGECDLASEGVYSAFNSYEFDELVTLLTYVSKKTDISPQILLGDFWKVCISISNWKTFLHYREILKCNRSNCWYRKSHSYRG